MEEDYSTKPLHTDVNLLVFIYKHIITGMTC